MPALNGAPVGIPSSNTKILFGLETVFGTEPAVGNLHLLPCNSFDGEAPFDVVEDRAYRGSPSQVFNAWQGVGHGQVQLETNFYPEECGYFLALIMGAVTTSGTGPYTHVMVADPASLSLSFEEQGAGGATIPVYTGQRVGSVSLRFSGATGLITLTANTQGQIYSERTPAVAPADLTSAPLFGYQGTVSVNGTADAQILEGEFTFSRDLLLHRPINNTQQPGDVLLSPLDVSWSLTMRPTSGANALAWRNYYRNFSIQPLQFAFTNPNGRSLTILMTRAEFGVSPLKIDRGDIQAIKLSLQGKGLGNATDGSASILSPARVTLVNQQTSYTT